MPFRTTLHPILEEAAVALKYPRHFLPIIAAFIMCILPASAFGADAAVSVSSLTFTPRDVTINVGDKVTWTGLLNGTGHNVAQSVSAGSFVYDGSGFYSGLRDTVSTFVHTFNSAGTFFYLCEPHAGADMKGTVTVQQIGDPANLYVKFNAQSNGVGTQGSPFDNLKDAVTAASASGTIRIDSGTSTETFTAAEIITKALTLLNRTPGSGSVFIGGFSARSSDRSGGFRSRPPGNASAGSDEDSGS